MRLPRLLAVTGLLAAALGAAPVSAAVMIANFDFTAASSSAEKLTTGSLVFKSTNSNVTATVSAYNLTPVYNSSHVITSYTLSQAQLGFYQGGLGVTSGANDDINVSGCGIGDCGTHQIDNFGGTANSKSYDFLQVTFSTPATIGGVSLNAFKSYDSALKSQTALDDDFSYGKNTTGTINSLSDLFQTNVSSNQAQDYTLNSTLNSSCQDKNGDGVCSNAFVLNTANQATANSAASNWYIGASIADNYGGDGIVDGFKLASATVYYIPAAVPETSTWSMMIIGFGAIGATMRRQRRTEALALLTT